MRTPLILTLIAAVLAAPLEVLAQHGGHGGAFGGGGAGGGWRGGGGNMGGHGATSANTFSRPTAGGAARPAVHPVNNFNHAGFNHANFSANRPMYHGNWYHGDWHGHWGGAWGYRPYGWGGWGGPGFGWGLGIGLGVGVGATALALGSPWGWGYYGYYNPYWGGGYGNGGYGYGGNTYINYSQPVVMAQPAAGAQQTFQPQQGAAPGGYNPYTGQAPQAAAPSLDPAQQARQDEALGIFDNARNLFQRGSYKEALAQTDRAIKLLPNDSVMHEFRALCLFATGDYQQAAAAVYAVVSVGPGWDWTTVSNLYPNNAVYAQQLAALENYRNEHPDQPGPRFLLGYHYLLAGHNQQAVAELEQVVALQPKDTLSAQLLKGLTTPAGVPQPGPPAEAAAPVEPAAIVGNWKSSRPDGSQFEMSLGADNKFTWNFSQQDKKQSMKGSYTLADNYLILKASDQNALVGQVELAANNQLNFKLAGGNPSDPGLTFTR